MLKFSKKVILGTIVGTILMASSAFAWTAHTKSISARFAQIKLIVNGKTIQTKAEPFIYNGNVYAPVATVANMLGIHQEWDNKTPAVHFEDKEYQANKYPMTQAERAGRDSAQWYRTTELGGKISMTKYDPVDVPEDAIYTLKDANHGINRRLPNITKDGYYNKQYPLSQRFTNVTGNSNYEFVVSEELRNKETGDAESWISVYRYENKQVTRVNSEMVHKFNYKPIQISDTVQESEWAAISFSDIHALKEITIHFYDITSTLTKGTDGYNRYIPNRDLVSVKVYEYRNGKLEFKKDLK